MTKSKETLWDRVAAKIPSSNTATGGGDIIKSATSSLLEAGSSLESSASDGKIYMAMAAGFVSVGRYLDPGKIVIKRTDDEEEFDPSDPGPPPSQETQDQLAAEQNTLVAEMGKANSITDQMYAHH